MNRQYVITDILLYFICVMLFLCCLIHIYDYTSSFGYKCAVSYSFEKTSVLTLRYNEQNFLINFDDYKKYSDNFIIQSQNSRWGRDGNIEKAIFTIQNIVKMGFTYERAFEFVYNGINANIDKILKKIEIEPKNSKIIFTPNFSQKFQVTSEKMGLKVDKEQLYKDIFYCYHLAKNNEVPITTHIVDAEITKEENLKATHKLSSFSTDISKSSADRKHNVKKALSTFNGMRIEPNEIVSFNKTTGRRTIERGYKNAHIILNEMFVDGVGGGVCQSSTTLYNALLLADNIQILQSSRHSMPVGYVQLGFDAMVSYGSSDLVFQNNSEMPVFLHTYSKNDIVTVEVYGKGQEENYTKKRRTEIIKTIPAKPSKTIVDEKEEYLDRVEYSDEKYILKHSQKGYEVQTYIDYYDNDTLIKSVPIRHCTYPAQEGIVVVGSKERESENF